MQPVGNFADAWNWFCALFGNIWPFVALAIGLAVTAAIVEVISGIRGEVDRD